MVSPRWASVQFEMDTFESNHLTTEMLLYSLFVSLALITTRGFTDDRVLQGQIPRVSLAA